MSRQDIVNEAIRWLRTPWHHRACVKGAGVDCVFLLVGVFNAVGLTKIADGDIDYYPADIMLHRNEETVLKIVQRYADEVSEPLPGDVVLWRFGRIYSHAAIVIDYPKIIHASRPDRIVLWGDALKGELGTHAHKYFRMRGVS